MPDDFDKMIAALREMIDGSADDLYRQVVAEMRERVVELSVLIRLLRKLGGGF